HVHRQNNDCTGDGFAEAERLGRDLGEVVDAVLADTAGSSDTAVDVVRDRTIDVEVGDTMLAGGRPGRTVTIDLVEWSIGPVRLVSIPGEGFHALGRAIEDRVREQGQHVVLAGLAPEWHGYLPSPFRDGYEESMSYGEQAVALVSDA